MLWWILVTGLAWVPAARGTVVLTDHGLVRGSTVGACQAFYGIPYATQHRFAPPQPPESWTGIRDGTQDIHPECLQLPDAGALGFREGWVEWLEERLVPANMSEDCLFVNVQTPNVTGKRAVMLFIHGGSYLSGSGSGRDASVICEEDIVYVSFNYRLGVLANLAIPELLAESGTVGNWGLQDQRAAMQWVQRNIARFGGDPSRVTISGESSGAMAVYAHSALARSQGLFHQSIAMSGNDMSLTLQQAYSAGQAMLGVLGCGGPTVLTCLRTRPALSIVNLQTAVYNQSMRALQAPVVDGFELSVSLRERYLSGAVSTPMLLGHNAQDISLFLAFTAPELLPELTGQPPVAPADIRNTLPRYFPNATAAQLQDVLRMYPLSSFASPQRALYELTTDGYFGCPTERVAQSVRANVFRYKFKAVLHDPLSALGLNFSLVPGWLNRHLNTLDVHILGSFHGANEMVFWRQCAGLDQREKELGAHLVAHWASFVRTGSPLASWPATNGSGRAIVLDFGESDVVRVEEHPERCELIDRLQFSWDPPT